MRPDRPGKAVDADEVDEGQHRLADEPERQGPPDRDLEGERQGRVRGDPGAEPGHVPVGADDHEQVEQKRNGDKACGFDEAKAAGAANQRHDRADRDLSRRPRTDVA